MPEVLKQELQQDFLYRVHPEVRPVLHNLCTQGVVHPLNIHNQNIQNILNMRNDEWQELKEVFAEVQVVHYEHTN